MKTAEERYEETWNSYLELLNKDPRASLKVLLVQKGEEEEKTKRALKVLGKLNRNKSEKQTPPAQETETPGNNNNTATEESHGKKERPHTNNGAKRKVYYDIETVPQDIQERGEMVPQTCMFPTCEKEVPRLWRRLRLQGDSQADKLHLPSGPQAQDRTCCNCLDAVR